MIRDLLYRVFCVEVPGIQYRFTQVTIQLTLDHGFRTVAIDLIALLLADL